MRILLILSAFQSIGHEHFQLKDAIQSGTDAPETPDDGGRSASLGQQATENKHSLVAAAAKKEAH